MDIQPFFTEEEKKQFFSKYKQLLRHLYSFLKKEDLSKMKELMKRVVALDCYGRDKNGINGLLRNIDTVEAYLGHRPPTLPSGHEKDHHFRGSESYIRCGCHLDHQPPAENFCPLCPQYGCRLRKLP